MRASEYRTPSPGRPGWLTTAEAEPPCGDCSPQRLNEWAPAGLGGWGLLLTLAGAVFTRTFRGVYDVSAGLCVQLQSSLTVG